MSEVRTRFAPSPTGFMHIGNLRTALYSYLLAKSKNGKFILRIEDTDQKRYVNGAINVIFNVLKQCNLNWDEGPDIGGKFGPYIQSERYMVGIYKKYAKQLVEQGDAYYCFCPECKTDLDQYKEECHYVNGRGYDGHCRNLSEEEIKENLKNNKPFVIRQKIPCEGTTKYHDEVFGDIEIENSSLDDQVLIKQDGFPTYNFANVIDDHLMGINYVVRGCEYLSSTPKYNLLYKSFGWDIPKYIHLPLIMGEQYGVVSKLSKRNGSVTFEDFIEDGYTKEAIINYIALLGWTPNGNQEFFTLDEMIKLFKVKNLNKSPSVFDYKKLNWINGKYIRSLSDNLFLEQANKYSNLNKSKYNDKCSKILLTLKNKISKFTEIDYVLQPFFQINSNFDLNFFVNDKIKSNYETALKSLNFFNQMISKDSSENIVKEINDKEFQNKLSNESLTKAQFMTALRVSLTGIPFTVVDPLLMIETMDKDEILKRINSAINRLK